MGMTLSSRSPAMAYADGGMWVSTFDEAGRRCWVNTVTGQRTYEFIQGKPVASVPHSPYVVTQSPYPAHQPYAAQQSAVPNHHAAPWAQSSPSTAPLPTPDYAAPDGTYVSAANTAAMVPYSPPPPGYGTGGPPVTPSGNGLAQRLQRYYLRPSSERSWMWKQ